ncbi:AraC family transcriptional regulator [Mycolicibacterium sp. 120270]|uniref:AraC family transcriptional regulator n=1 Tax=Mycolicibacterium sp. 120270 TaxID=3090600 RepID=UPI00299ED20F|nr:AraC family transcriptional regulator [Mycolicibacterium sp. 120270]MDX1882752.1 AraC family transcriptional regulator [Mycolicibacterium sp. 120270]
MHYTRHTPTYPLCDFVEYLWCLTDGPTHSAERILPGGTTELVINLHDNEIRVCDPVNSTVLRYSGAVVAGPYSRAFDIDASRHAAMLGVHFKPGGARALLGLPLHELRNTHVDLEQLWNAQACALRARVCEARSDAERFAVVETALCSKLRPDLAQKVNLTTALAALVPGTAQPAIGTLAERVGLSHREFIKRFTVGVGMAPKLFARVRRFHLAANRIRAGGAPRWSEFAVEIGYADQAHMIRDFHAFAGMTPVQYHDSTRAPAKDDHVALTA